MAINKTENDGVTVPIAVDSVKDTPSFLMTRCTYFSIESTEPDPGWAFPLYDTNIPFIMLGLSGVITSPPGGTPYFDTPDHLDNLFDSAEQNERLYVDTNDIWLPNILFNQSGIEPRRGHVYRIGFDLFKVAYLLREEVNTDEEFMARMEEWDVEGKVETSDSESEALMQWNQNEIEVIQTLYHENPLKNLDKKQDLENPLPPLTP